MPKKSQLEKIKYETAQEFGLTHRVNQHKNEQGHKRIKIMKDKFTLKK